MDQSLVSVMRNINDALHLDDGSHDKEAYMKYLDCVLCITCNLQQSVQNAGGDVVISKQVTKQVKLAQQCIDRVSVLVDKLGLNQKPVVLKSPQERETVAVKPKPFVTVPPLPFEPAVNMYARTKRKTPMEMAYKQNHQLMAAYRARMKRMNKGDPGAFNLSLTIQRKMAENLAIAKRTEMALAKKMQERQERLEEQAAKRFVTPIGMSEEEQEQRQIYKKILEYEQDAKWLQNWRGKVESNPQEPELICQLIQEILRCQDHPLTLLLKQYQYKIYEKVYPLVSKKKPLLDAVRVPLSLPLWPPELCDGVAGKEGHAKSLPARCGDGTKVLEEDEGSQSTQDSLSQSHCAQQGEDSVCGKEHKVGEDNPSSQSEETETDQVGDNSDTNNGPELSIQHSHQEICQETEKSTDKAALQENTSNYVSISEDAPTQDAVVSLDVCDETPNVSDGQPGSDSESTEVIHTETEEGSHAAVNAEKDVQGSGKSVQEKSNTVSVPAEDSHVDSMVSLAEDTKEEVLQAIARGEHQQAQLRSEHEKAARILCQLTQDYERYNAENMDDLFDSGEEEEEEASHHAEIQPKEVESTRPGYSFTSSSVTSQTALPDRLISRSSSGGSVQDFPSLPLPDEGESRKEIERLSKEAYQRHLKNISADIHMYMEKLLILFTIAYEQLDCPLGRDQCYASLEETFFKPVWKCIMMLFRLTNYKDEIVVACKMTQKADVGPKELGVTDKLCLKPSPTPDASIVSGDARPYLQAIQQLARVQEHYTILSKLECIVKVVHLIFDCIKEFYTQQGYKSTDIPSVGADDLLPVMSYVVVQSRLPQLVSECHALSEFVHEGYIMGQEGYCLTTLETAVSFIVSSNLNHPFSPD